MFNLQEIALHIISGDHDVNDTDVQRLIDLASDIYFNIDEAETTDLFSIMINGNTISVPYSRSEPIMDDEVYNSLERFFRERCPTFKMETGSDVRTGKEKLPFIMGGLTELYENETEQWIFKHQLVNEEFLIEDKLDGISASLIYENGVFVSGYSRGNGTYGADISRHLRNIPSVPKTIKTKERLELRAEVIIPVKLWKDHQAQVEKQTGKFYKNPRNYVAGKMNSKTADQSFYDVVNVVITSLNNREEHDVIKNLEFVRTLKFLVVEYVVINGKDINDMVLTEILFNRRKESIYEIDGVVLTPNNATVRNSIPKTTSTLNAAHSVKIKFGSPENNAQTTVIRVHYDLSKDGYAKPRIEIDPVELGGVTITFTTGFNAGYIKKNNIGPGTIVDITRSGDVIPYIEKVVQGTIADLPDNLEDYYWTEGEVDLVLLDPSSSIDVTKKKLLGFFTGIDVPKLKEASISKLVEAGIDDISSIIKMSREELQSVIGKSAGNSVYEGIKDKLNPVSLATIAASSQTLGRGLGSRKLQRVIDRYGKLDVTILELLEVEGWEDKTASLYISNFPKFEKFLEQIDGYYTILNTDDIKVSNGMEGMTVVLTGFRDKELEKLVVSKGGKIGSSVSKSTTVLVCANVNDGGSKIAKANELGILKMTPEEAYSAFSEF